MADDPFGSIFGAQGTPDPFNSIFGKKEEEPPSDPRIRAGLGMGPAPDRIDPTGAEATLDFLKQQPAPDEFAIRRNERRRAEEAKAEAAANTITPDSDLDFYWEKFKRGLNSALGGASRSQAAIYESLGLDQMADIRTEKAEEYEKKAGKTIAGETTMDEAWNRLTGGEYKDENGNVIPYTRPTAKVIANFVAEAGVESTPQMVMAIASLPSYVYSLAGSIGQQRAENDNRTTADLGDILISAPAATISAYLDRLPLEAIFTRKLGETATKRIIAGAMAEGATEGVQSGIEYTAGTLGTEKGGNAQEALKQIVMGSIAGAPLGGTLAGVTEGAGAVSDKVGEARERTAFDEMFGEPQGPAPSEAAVEALDPTAYDTGENRPSVPLNEGDVASSLPTEAIQAGKNKIADILGERPAAPAKPKGALPSDIVEFFRSKGYSEAHARGIAAGIVAESRGDHSIVNPDSGAAFLGQWLGSRKAELFKRYGPNPTRKQQLEFLHWELQGGDFGGKDVLAAKDERGVLDAYIKKFMRPAAGAETTGDISRGLAALGLGEDGTVTAEAGETTASPEEAVRREVQSPEEFLKEVLGEDVLDPVEGERVDVTQNNATIPGTVEQVWEQDGRRGVRVALDDGTVFDEALEDAAEFGARITKPVTQSESLAGNQLDSSGPGVRPVPASSIPVGSGKPADVGSSDIGAVPKSVANYVDRYIAGEWRDQSVPRAVEQFAANNAKEIEAEFQRRAVEAPVEERGTTAEEVTSKPVETLLEDTSQPAKFDAVALVPKLKEIVAKGSVPLGNIKKVAEKLGVKPAQARAVMGVLASQPNSGVTMSKKGQLRRVGKRTAPMSAMEFVRSLGGVQSGSHDLRNVGAIGRHPGVISNKKGRTLDEIGEALHEAGYFTDRDPTDPAQRPTVAETIDFLDRASIKRAYTAGNERQETPDDDEQRHQKEAAVDAEIADSGHDLNDDERADALRYVEDGLSAQAAVRAAMDDAAARVLDTGADETGNDFYAEVRDSIYAGEEPEQRDGRAEEAVDGPESVEGDAEGSDSADAQPEEAGRERVAAPKSTAPEHAQVGVDDRELAEVVVEFEEVLASQGVGEEQITHIFDPPAQADIVRLNQKSRVYHKDHGWMSVKEAKAKIAEWEAHAVAQGKDAKARSINSDKVVLSFFDLSGSWSEPWVQAGYDVYRFDIQDDPEVGDVNNFSTEFFNDWFGSFEGREIHAILSANPCTDFASSGARHFAAKDKDGRTVASVRLVQQTLAAIEYFKPAVWAIENPVGRIEKLGGLPPWRLSFDPNDVGDPYTKKTLIWGRFNADLPVAPVDPVEGSKMHRLYGGKSIATKNARSVTPEGFAYAFFMANNAVDHPAQAVAGQFDRLDRKLIEKAIDAGVTPEEITTAVEDFYYQDLDDDAANAAIQDLIDGVTNQGGETDQTEETAPQEPTPEEIMGPRDTDVRDTLQRKANERLIPAVEQKPVGSDGGLFDTQDTTGDLFAEGQRAAEPVEASQDPVERVVGALQGAIDALKPKGEILQDTGEKIGGARKDMWAARGLNLDDLAGLSQGEAFQFVTKDQVWPKPDFTAILDSGATPEVAAAVKLLRDSLAAKPKVDSEEGRRDYVEALQAARAAIGEPKTLDDLKGVQTRLYESLGVETGYRMDRTEEGKAARRKLFSIFKGNTARFNVDYSMGRKIKKLLDTGWPTDKAAAWTRRFDVRQAYSRDGAGKWFVTNKQRRIVADDLDSKEAAEAKALELYTAATTNPDGSKKSPDRPRLDNLQRTGEDVRGDRDISAEDFIKEFGFRGVEFGNWVAGDERQKSVNLAYEGLHDLAATLGIPPETLSLGGQLGLAFGARGSGKAAAHYEPAKLVINLTKTSGAGTLAHEWGHALDNYFGLLDSQVGTRGAPIYASGGRDTYNFKALGNLRPELAADFDALMDAIFKRDKTRAEMVRDTEQRIERLNAGIARQKEALAKAPRGNHPSNRKFIRDSENWIEANEKLLLKAGERLAELRDEAKPVEPQKVESSFYENAQLLSGQSGKKGYWARPTELFARTFEAYVFDKIKAGGNISQYLVQGVEENRFPAALYGGNPYPVGAERAKINAAYDKLFDTIKVRQIETATAPIGTLYKPITPSQEEIFEQRQADIRRIAAEQIKQLLPGDKVALEFAERISVGNGIGAQGTYWRRIITLATIGATSPQWTLAHESVHAMKAMGLFTPSEWALLVREANKEYPNDLAKIREQWAGLGLTKEQFEEEAVAELFGRYWFDLNVAPPGKGNSFLLKMAKRLLNVIAAVARAINAVRGLPNPNGLDAFTLMQRMERGEIGARPIGYGEAPRDTPLRGGATVTFGNKVLTQAEDGPRLSVAGAINPSSPEFSDPETERRWKEAQKGIGDGPSTMDKAREWWADLTSGFTRHWRNLPNEARFADIGQQFRKLEAAPEAAMEKSVRYLRDLVGKMDKVEYDLFSRKVVLDDLAWEAGEGHELPFGLTPATLKAERQNIDAQIGLSPKLIEAVRKRKAHNKEVADAMVSAGVLSPEQIKNPAYFRHMVLDYARHEAAQARGPGSKIKSPYWAKRLGSTLDINANLLEAELDWLLKAQVDITTANTIEWVKKSDHNIRERLRTEAKASNKAAIDAIIASDPDAKKEDGKFRSMIGLGFQKVKDELEAGTVGVIPPNLRQIADDLKNDVQDGEMPYPLLAWMLDNNKPGAMGAAMVLKYGGLRKAWMRNRLGEKYLDPDDVAGLVKKMKPDGYKAWQPIEGRHMFTAKTISESALDMFVGKLSETTFPGVDKDELHRALTTIRPQLVVGGDRYTMVLPEEVADTLTEFGDRRAEGMVGRVFSGIQGAWKRWALINPRRFLKYNLNNMTGDLDAIIAGNPGTLRKVKSAWTMLRDAANGKIDPRYQEAQDRGVFTSGLSIQEIPDINRLSELRHLTEDRGVANKLTIGAVAKVWRFLQDTTQFRESLFRLAAYLDYIEKIEAGTPQLKIGYGASVPKMVEAVSDPKDRAALLARDLVGDYGAISVAGGWLRKYLIPFWSWTEINTRRYWRLTNNAFSTSKARGIATGGLLGAGVAARVAVSLGIRMAAVYGLLYLWNHLLFPDEEDDLGDLQKRQLHLILGRDSDGEVITLRTQGALSDVLGLLGVPDAIAGLKQWQNGQGSIGQAIKDTLKAPVNRVATATSPIYSVPLEQALGKELWPDIFDAREIKDRWRHVFETVSLEHEYDQVADKPTRGYARSWTESIIYRRDPGEMAFDEAKGIAYEWLSNVKGQEAGGSTSPRSAALRDYRMAMRYGDTESAEEALQRYAEFGGTAKGFKQSIKRQHPLAPIPKKYRVEFLDSLTDEQLDTFAEAEEYYKRIYLGVEPTSAAASR